MSTVSVHHLPLAGYAVSIAATLGKVVPTVFQRKLTPMSLVFLSMAVGALASTWSYMLVFFQKSFTDSGAFALGASSSETGRQADLVEVHSDSSRDPRGAVHDLAMARRRLSLPGGVAVRLHGRRQLVVVAAAVPVHGRPLGPPHGNRG